MPTSDHRQISRILDVVMELRPMSVLDVGAGTGKWGLLLREYLDLWVHQASGASCIEGVEIWKPYIGPIHRLAYDAVFNMDVMDLLENPPHRWDLILAVDVVEHLQPEDCPRFLDLGRKAAKHLVIVTPRKLVKQGAVNGNPYEEHLTRWAPTGGEKWEELAKSWLIYVQGEP